MKNKYRDREVAHNFDHLPHDQTVMSVYIFMRKTLQKAKYLHKYLFSNTLDIPIT